MILRSAKVCSELRDSFGPGLRVCLERYGVEEYKESLYRYVFFTDAIPT